MRNFKTYKVWELGHQLTLDMYKSTRKFPKEEIYGLTSQIRRASYSIPANIAEGCGRESEPEFKRFLTISQGSASELEYFNILARDLEIIDHIEFEKFDKQINLVKRSLHSLIKKLK